MKLPELGCPHGEILELPPDVEEVAGQLRSDPTVQEIWLIGSRASGSASPTSDWDLLVRSDRDPGVAPRRSPNVDVLWCGPSGATLVEGEEEYLKFDFSDFQWEVVNCSEAAYVGRRFKEFEYGVAHDSSEPRYVRDRQSALLLWKRTSA
jgi:predicted nucleotidyltransferase